MIHEYRAYARLAARLKTHQAESHENRLIDPPTKLLRQALDAAIERQEATGVGVVDAVPDQAADRVGQPVPRLRDADEARLLGRDGPLPAVFDAVDLEGQRPPPPRAAERPGVDALGSCRIPSPRSGRASGQTRRPPKACGPA